MKVVYVPSDSEIKALKAVAVGKASAGQQQLALRFVFNISGIRNAPEVFENPIEQGFDTGKRFVGWQVARLIELTGVTTDTDNQKES